MELIKTFLTEAEAFVFIDKQKQPRLGGYIVKKDIFSGKFNVYLMD